MKRLNLDIVKEGMRIMVSGLERREKLWSIRASLLRCVGMYGTVLNEIERARVFQAFWRTIRIAYRYKNDKDKWQKVISLRANYDKMLGTVKKVAAENEARVKQEEVRAQLEDDENIFFFCSWHENCADDHKEFQGKIYVDSHWRLKVKPVDYTPVRYYINNHRVISIQSAMKKPIYLTTRPNCRHFFVPVPTATVLNTSVNIMKQWFAKQNFRPFNEGDYFERRKATYDELNLISPCKWFREKGSGI